MPSYEDQLPKLKANLNLQYQVQHRDHELLDALETLRAARIMTSTSEKKQFYVQAFNEILNGSETSQGTSTTDITSITNVDNVDDI